MSWLRDILPTFNSASPGAAAIEHLFVVVLIVCAVILAIVTGLVVTCIVRFRARPGETNEPRQIFGHNRLELVWTLGPFLTLVVIFALTLSAMRAASPDYVSGEPDLVVRAHQWWWEVAYPRAGFTTANEIHLPAGRDWIVRLESADVIHDFWVPRLERKIDMTPGHPTQIRLRADAPGRYAGVCAEFCGDQHAWMRFEVVAQAPAEFAEWVAAQQRQPEAPSNDEIAAGRELFEQFTCVNCHAVAGLSGDAQLGPDLTHFASRRNLGAGVLPNTPENIRRWIEDPQAVKPGCLMPTYHLTGEQTDRLVAYLQSLR